MGYLAQAIAGRSDAKAVSLRELLAGTTGWLRTNSGKTVSPETALQVSAVLACTRVRANGLAQVPLKLMQETGRRRIPAKNHALYEVLALRPNSFQTSFEYRETIGCHLTLCGSHFSFINRTSRHPLAGTFGSHIAELIPFEPQQVTVKRADDWSLSYDVRAKNGSVQTFPAESIWHIRGPSWNGWQGMEPVKLAREAVGLAMATEEAAARLHRNGVRPSGVYSVEGKLDDIQYKSLKGWIDSNLAGLDNSSGTLLMDRAAKWINTQMTGIDAQTADMRRFQVEEIARALGVNPIMIFAESKNTTYASAEQMFLAHLVHTLAPEYERIEQSIAVNLLTDADRKAGIYANFVEEGLLRGSADGTKDVLLGYVNGGLMTANEGRAKLDMDPDADPASDKLRVPANIVGAVKQPEPPKGTTP